MFHHPHFRGSHAGHLLRLTCVLVLGIAVASPGYAQKTDEVYLTNGDRITGDVKGLERGRLLVKTKSMGSIYLEWTAVAHVVSDKPLQVELTSGRRLLGSLERAEDDQIQVAGVFGETEGFPVDSIVRMDPVHVDRNFW